MITHYRNAHMTGNCLHSEERRFIATTAISYQLLLLECTHNLTSYLCYWSLLHSRPTTLFYSLTNRRNAPPRLASLRPVQGCCRSYCRNLKLRTCPTSPCSSDELSYCLVEAFARLRRKDQTSNMATALATKPPPPLQKMKRPPPPVQTAVNGARSSHSSPSPSISSKRPPSGFKHASSSTAINGVNGINGINGVNGVNGNMNGGIQRSSNRRRDSQKLGDLQGRQGRPGKAGQGDAKLQRRKPEPYSKCLWTMSFNPLVSSSLLNLRTEKSKIQAISSKNIKMHSLHLLFTCIPPIFDSTNKTAVSRTILL